MWVCVVVVLSIVLIPVHSDVTDFFKTLSYEFTDAWKWLKNAIQQPVRIRRLGKIGKLKKTKPPSTTTMRLLPAPSTPQLTINTMRITPMPLSRRVEIPLLRKPQDTSLVQWSQIQNPFISGFRRRDFLLRGGEGIEVLLERTILPTLAPGYYAPSRAVVVPILKLPTFSSFEQSGYLQLPRYVTMKPKETNREASTIVEYAVDTNWLSEESKEITEPQRAEYFSHTLLTENLIEVERNIKKKQNVSRLKYTDS